MSGRAARQLLVPGVLVGAIIVIALVVPFLPLPDPIRMDVAARLLPPSALHPLGQDEYGRDVLSRILWGARTSLVVASLAAASAAIAGTLLGLLGGYFRGLVEVLTVRSAEIILCFPPILLALLVVTWPDRARAPSSLHCLFFICRDSCACASPRRWRCARLIMSRRKKPWVPTPVAF